MALRYLDLILFSTRPAGFQEISLRKIRSERGITQSFPRRDIQRALTDLPHGEGENTFRLFEKSSGGIGRRVCPKPETVLAHLLSPGERTEVRTDVSTNFFEALSQGSPPPFNAKTQRRRDAKEFLIMPCGLASLRLCVDALTSTFETHSPSYRPT